MSGAAGIHEYISEQVLATRALLIVSMFLWFVAFQIIGCSKTNEDQIQRHYQWLKRGIIGRN
jgi:hypothetical protein